ncbi:small basic protein 1 [Meleagris gallopavo]|uniref:OvoDB1 n=2 Tax=Phasianidae TaxID=9005 RepID=A0A0A8WGW6_MELGA|nr:small basic protein 1 [Meleagris gallopavo]XP_031459682.1 small basic protein 1-like [Phasianus colchicus]CEK97810.1 OvoDB1 [Meleagris gallopavo]
MRLLCVLFAVLLLFSLATPGYGQHKGTCKGYCASACNKKDEWTFHQSCKKMYCCLPPPKKGK